MRYAIIFLCLMFAGCSTLQKGLENRIACTPDGKPWVLSKWWLFAIGSELAEGDAKVCEVRK